LPAPDEGPKKGMDIGHRAGVGIWSRVGRGRVGSRTRCPTRPQRRPEAGGERPVVRGRSEERDWQAVALVASAVGAWVFLLAGVWLDHVVRAPHSVVVGCYVLSYLSGGTVAVARAARDLVGFHVNVDLLMVLAAGGAAVVDAWAEGAVLLALFSTSNALEHLALGRTRRAVRALMDLSPPVATVVRPAAPGGEAVVPVEELVPGDVVVVRPGERLPADGEVVAGRSSVDQAVVTGESIPIEKEPGDGVFSGTINGTGVLRIRVTKLAAESTVARIVRLVEAAQEEKGRAQRFADAFEGPYAVGVIVASALVAVVPTLFGEPWGSSFYRAMTLLVVASPCALVISTPAATLSALANAARRGILIKGARHLENLGAITTVALDKTGTLTAARLGLTEAVALAGPGAWSEAALLQRAASAERSSEHPLAMATVAAARARGLEPVEPVSFRALPGRGIVAALPAEGADEAGRELAVGNEVLFGDLGIPVPPDAEAILVRCRTQGRKAVLLGEVGRDGEPGVVRGVLAYADAIRPEAAAAVAELRRLGVRRVVMLTGDHEEVAGAIAAKSGISEVRAELLPDEKVSVVQDLLTSGPTMMVGDGINDAPALATATVGVAMGAAGTDVALETADVVLMGDDLRALVEAVALSRRTRRIIRQNVTFALGVIVVLVGAALTVGIPLPLGVVGHEGSTVIVVLNGLRLLRR
jgi:Cd2+/Zn2+-exporting ATPase